MKKAILIISILYLIINCSNNQNDGIIQITERLFVGQVNNIYLNNEDYLGKTIKIEGLFMNDQGDGEYDPLYAVFRYGPGGCCGIDGIVGFEVKWTNGGNNSYPVNNAWVEAIGELNEYKDGNYQILYLNLISLNVLDNRGKEYVTR